LGPAQLGSNNILNELEFELELARILNEPSLNKNFIAWLELDSNKDFCKLAKLEILKLDSTRLDYSPRSHL
jgi:hypothetical protein